MRPIDADKLREEWIWGSTDRTANTKCIELVDLDAAPTLTHMPVGETKEDGTLCLQVESLDVLEDIWRVYIEVKDQPFCNLFYEDSNGARGHWEKVDPRSKSQRFRCSVCGGITYWKQTGNHASPTVCKYPYCPNCGTTMEVSE